MPLACRRAWPRGPAMALSQQRMRASIDRPHSRSSEETELRSSERFQQGQDACV